jgi:hypothetical protein
MERKDITEIRDSSSGKSNVTVPYGSNCVRLSLADWIIVAIVLSTVFYLVPMLWERAEKFEPYSDYRISYDFSSDYWLYKRYCRLACSRYETLVIGDSVIWGHFVPVNNTLSHHLNDLTGTEQFANLGADGTHPAALEGLLRYYGRDISDKNVILHLNPLWMTSPKQDLQTEKEHRFNHPKLVSQFIPRIPCYKASFPERISNVINRRVPFFSFSSHLNITCFQSMDIPAWTIEHPYKNPLRAITFRLPTSDDYERPKDATRPGRGPGQTNFQWVELETSLQWLFFRRTVELLRQRSNRVFILVGPFNEHMLDADNLDNFRKMKTEIKTWFRRNNVPYYMPDVLPAHVYVDSSHPLGEGYAAIAKQLFENAAFRSNILSSGSGGTD